LERAGLAAAVWADAQAGRCTLPQTPEEMTREIQQLRKELARVTTQRDILKKTMGILSEG
jgi:hypothetical protein